VGLLALADYFVPNIDEARALTGETDPRRQTDCLIQHGAQRVLIKLGDRGTYVRSTEREFEIAAPQVNTVEPSGAGDALPPGSSWGYASVGILSAPSVLPTWPAHPHVPPSDPGVACSPASRLRRCSHPSHYRCERRRRPDALEPMTEILERAREGGYAVGYFEAWDSYSLEAVVEAAEAERAPVILGFGCLLLEQEWLEDGGIETLGCIGSHAAARARVPVSLLLNEAQRLEHALRGIDAGFNAVMLCTDDVDVTVRLVQRAHETWRCRRRRGGHIAGRGC